MINSTTLCDAFQRTAAAYPEAVALRAFGTETAITWAEYAEQVRTIAAKLAALGVGKGDSVGFMLTNRPEFHLCDTAAMHLGAACYSIYNTSPRDQIAHIVANAGSRVLIAESQFMENLKAAVPDVEHVLDIDAGDLTSIDPHPSLDFDAAWRSVQPDDVATLIYTSGTTGPPKGVELTHANIAFSSDGIGRLGEIRAGDRMISYLPAAHIADRAFSHYFAMSHGIEITCLADHTLIAGALAEVRPTVFAAVPRVWEKLKLAIEMQLAGHDDLRAAFEAGDPQVRAVIRDRLGLDEVRWAMSGAAPLAIDVHEFMIDLGLPVTELWGMSECGLGSASAADQIRVGTVGQLAPGLEGRIADDGELLVRGPGVMKGYRNEPEKTAEALDADGWLHTGDIATLDDDGYLQIVDRKKELIINAAGKNMSPANVQNAIVSGSPLIGSAMVVGDARPYNVALVVLDPDAAAAFAAQHGLDADPAVLTKDDGVQAAVSAGVEAGNSTLSRVEQIKRFTILPTYWEPGSDELTPTMKLRRRKIAEKYATEIDDLYEGTAG